MGKSTLARWYVDDHPGALNLEIDIVASLVGGWRDDFYGVLAAARNMALAMAEAHLRSGSDVIVPQLETSVDEAARFQNVAERVGADYVEVVLRVEPAEQMKRFAARSTDTELNAHIGRVVAAEGGAALLRRVNQRLDTYLGQRPSARHLETAGADVSECYAQMLRLVNARY